MTSVNEDSEDEPKKKEKSLLILSDSDDEEKKEEIEHNIEEFNELGYVKKKTFSINLWNQTEM